MKNENQRDWFDFVFKIMGGLGVLLGGILIPYVMHVNSERNSNNQLYATIWRVREKINGLRFGTVRLADISGARLSFLFLLLCRFDETPECLVFLSFVHIRHLVVL